MTQSAGISRQSYRTVFPPHRTRPLPFPQHVKRCSLFDPFPIFKPHRMGHKKRTPYGSIKRDPTLRPDLPFMIGLQNRSALYRFFYLYTVSFIPTFFSDGITMRRVKKRSRKMIRLCYLFPRLTFRPAFSGFSSSASTMARRRLASSPNRASFLHLVSQRAASTIFLVVSIPHRKQQPT